MGEVEQVPGYRGFLPVHVGNSAASQRQMGSYGDLFDAVWHYAGHGERDRVTCRPWRSQTALANTGSATKTSRRR